MQTAAQENTGAEYYTFELSDNVTRTHVSYENRYGITIAADMYMASDLDTSATHPALVIGPPYGGVKEQGPGLYANELAQRGFVVLAFDPPYMGESGGEPRHVSSPDMFVESFSAGIDFLGTQSQVDREKIGVIGICGSGGFAVTATQVDARIKAVATTSMYDMSRNMRRGWEDSMTPEQLNDLLGQLSQQRWADAENGTPEFNPSFPLEVADAGQRVWIPSLRSSTATMALSGATTRVPAAVLPPPACSPSSIFR